MPAFLIFLETIGAVLLLVAERLRCRYLWWLRLEDTARLRAQLASLMICGAATSFASSFVEGMVLIAAAIYVTAAIAYDQTKFWREHDTVEDWLIGHTVLTMILTCAAYVAGWLIVHDGVSYLMAIGGAALLAYVFASTWTPFLERKVRS